MSRRPHALLPLMALLALSTTAWGQFGEDFDSIGVGDSMFMSGEPREDMVTLTAEFAPASADRPAMLAVTARVAEGFHIFSITQAKGGPQPTTIRLEGDPRVRLAGDWVADPAPETHIDDMAWEGLLIEEHFGEVTWRAPIELPEGADPTTLNVAGVADLQACTESNCHLLNGRRFTASLVQTGSIPAPPVAGSTPTAQTTETGASTEPVALETLLPILGAAFLGGLILNLMPCVLPVIGLKVLSFAEQAGHKRGRVLAMNIAYTAGLLSVFMVLALLASLVQLGLGDESYGWGELYTRTDFKIGMVILVFAMALSFLGVWKIPIPGFVGGREASTLQQKEGYAGAFFKGVFTTILATPCSGPFLGSAIGVTLLQPAWVTFAIFGSIGLGMASPYLLIGMFPGLVNALPKPGSWMATFKQLMGFLLMGTAIYLISIVSRDLYLPVLTTLLAVGFACWVIGAMPVTASRTKLATAWGGGVGVAVAAGVASFGLLGPSDHALQWKPYSEVALASAKQNGQTVLVEFTADWCLTCKLNLKRAINTDTVREVVEANEVVPLLADWTDESDEIKRTLESLGSRSIPLLAIYPASGGEPITLRDLISEEELLAALAEAGAVLPDSGASRLPEG